MKKLLASITLLTLLMGSSAYAAEDNMQMQQQLQKMDSLMTQIKAEQDPEKLEQLMSQHMDLMHEGMQMMGKESMVAAGTTMETRMEMMEGKMQMMQMMMGQMMDVEIEERSRPIHKHKK